MRDFFRRLFGRERRSTLVDPIVVPKVAMSRRTSAQAREGVSEDVAEEAETAVDPIFLRQQMSNHFDEATLVLVAETFGLDFAQLSGGKGRRVLQLVTHCEKERQLDVLMARCQELKPTVAWQLEA